MEAKTINRNVECNVIKSLRREPPSLIYFIVRQALDKIIFSIRMLI